MLKAEIQSINRDVMLTTLIMRILEDSAWGSNKNHVSYWTTKHCHLVVRMLLYRGDQEGPFE